MATRSQVFAVLTAMLALVAAVTWSPLPALAEYTCLVDDSTDEAEYVARVNQDLIDYGQRVASRLQAEGSRTADYQQVFFESVYILVEIGVFGCGDGGDDIYAGPTDPDEVVKLAHYVIEPFLTDTGSQLSAQAILRDTFHRLVATDMRALSPQEQIAISNSALLTGEPYMPDGSTRALAGQLDYTGQAYLGNLALGEVTGSYPQYLNDNGFANKFD